MSSLEETLSDGINVMTVIIITESFNEGLLL